MNGVWLPILAAIFGAIAAGGIQAILGYQDREREKAAVRAALVMEVRAICFLMRFREYLPFAQSVRSAMEADLNLIQSVIVDLREDYFSAYHALTPKLGMLDAKEASRIVEFYMLCKAAKDSVHPDGIHIGSDDRNLVFLNNEPLIKLIETSLKVGDEIAQWLPQPIEAQSVH